MKLLPGVMALLGLTAAYGGVIALVGKFYDYHVEPNGRISILTQPTISHRLGLGGFMGVGFAAVTLAVFRLSEKWLHDRGPVFRLFLTLLIGFSVCLFLFADFNLYVHFGKSRYPDAVHTGIWVKGFAAWPERMLLSVLGGCFLASIGDIPGILTTRMVKFWR